MLRWLLPLLVIAGLELAACRQATGADASAGLHGRYFGVGLYGPSRQWTKLVTAQPSPADPQTAQAIDDQVIIVVQDSATGEVRACGDLTGYCIGMNPWKRDLLAAQLAPLKLTEHRQDDSDTAAAAVSPKPHHRKRVRDDHSDRQPASAAA